MYMCITERAFWCFEHVKMTSIVIITDLQTLTYEVNCSVYVYVYVSILQAFVRFVSAVYLIESFTCSLFT